MIRRLLFAIALIIMVLSLINCKKGGDPEPSQQQVQLDKLVGTWNCSNATRDGVAQSGYSNFRLVVDRVNGTETFSYSTTGRPSLSPWPASGTGSFGTDVVTDLLRDGTLQATYSVAETQLEVSFNFTEAGFNGRTATVKGAWVFSFTK